MSKVWKTIPGFSCYRVSEIGEVECIELRGKMRSLGPVRFRLNDGYRHYSVRNDRGNSKTMSAHRLVALAFLPPPEADQTVVRHRNGLRCCNHFSNLAWGTHKQNAEDRSRHGRNGAALLNDAKVLEIRASRESYAVLAERYGVNWQTISAVRTGDSWKHLIPKAA